VLFVILNSHQSEFVSEYTQIRFSLNGDAMPVSADHRQGEDLLSAAQEDQVIAA
jgi:hypothetical protein